MTALCCIQYDGRSASASVSLVLTVAVQPERGALFAF